METDTINTINLCISNVLNKIQNFEELTEDLRKIGSITPEYQAEELKNPDKCIIIWTLRDIPTDLKQNLRKFFEKYDEILVMRLIESHKVQYNFKPFDKVLVRDHDDALWKPNLFCCYTSNEKIYNEDVIHRFPFTVINDEIYSQCIPYEGNEKLLNTSNKPKEYV